MAKFCLSDSENVLASVKDPVALDCISKLTQNDSEDTDAVGTKQESEQDIVESRATGESEPVVECDILQSSSTDRDLSTANTVSLYTQSDSTPVTSVSDCGVKCTILSDSSVSPQQSTVASEIPLFIASGDLLSFPFIPLPLVACSTTTSCDDSAYSNKTFVTVAAVGDLNSLPENVVINPSYRPL